MTDEQADKLTKAIERLAIVFERATRPVIIVTKDENNSLVQNYIKRGYPVYFP